MAFALTALAQKKPAPTTIPVPVPTPVTPHTTGQIDAQFYKDIADLQSEEPVVRSMMDRVENFRLRNENLRIRVCEAAGMQINGCTFDPAAKTVTGTAKTAAAK